MDSGKPASRTIDLGPLPPAPAWRFTCRLSFSRLRSRCVILGIAGDHKAPMPGALLLPGRIQVATASRKSAGGGDEELGRSLLLDGPPLLERDLVISASPRRGPVLTISGCLRELAWPCPGPPAAITLQGGATLEQAGFFTGPQPLAGCAPPAGPGAAPGGEPVR